MWQRFTERARKIVFYAQEEAQKYGEGYVSTEHLLLGLTRETDSVAARVLHKLGVSLDDARKEIEKHLPRGDSRPSQDMTLTPRAKHVIDLSYDEARNLNNNYIGTEHLLLGLVREHDGLAGRVLAKLGVELEATRHEVMAIQDAEPRPDQPATRSTTIAFPTSSDYDLRVSKQLGDVLAVNPDLLEDPAALAAVLANVLPGATRERRVLVHTLELRLPQEIADEEGGINRFGVLQWTERLEREIGLTRSAAIFAVRAWIAALGKEVE